METTAIKNLQVFTLTDEKTNQIYYGCNQEWYTSFWRRLSGCGPSTACNILFYLYQTRMAGEKAKRFHNKANCVAWMNEVWRYVTPTFRGIPTTKLFYESVLAYAQAKQMKVTYNVCNLPKAKASRPAFDEVVTFLKEALRQDTPVAFLNLCNGEEVNLEAWHWVTIVALECSGDERSVFVDIADGGMIKKIDLSLWYRTTKKGGGFVYFVTEP
ncbi:hypothetical protein [Heliophilum fasciatum]|uniref:Peptidase C39-like domain-containing protein n=1 Tax=Heliophilum fasciatum TaxID=35700 RepID=A0A4R2RL61_9FIRM|nr:hypothetical protein [Heliophilum fasciatum]MCW2278477.1 hypothetical protein [Heliophilum fasciatum]TCP63608.1 hypothetical protein EDD73_11733 [Heliophilum fasciatum]